MVLMSANKMTSWLQIVNNILKCPICFYCYKCDFNQIIKKIIINPPFYNKDDHVYGTSMCRYLKNVAGDQILRM